MRILDGAKTSEQIFIELACELEALAARGVRPGLAAVLVGDNPASKIYVNRKVKACERLKIHSVKLELPQSATTEQLLSEIDKLNRDPQMHGILVQLPLPPQIDEKKILLALDPRKDVDCLHPANVGRLTMNTHDWAPATPSGVMELLRRYEIPVEGKRVVVLGRSNLVGRPLALLMMHANATVTVCHSRTRDLAGLCRTAEILVAAIGKPLMITKEFVSSGAVVIDVGINRVSDESMVRRVFADDPAQLREFQEKKYLIVGDVCFPDVAPHVSAITPVPGGIGPMTIAMLMSNTVKAAKLYG